MSTRMHARPCLRWGRITARSLRAPIETRSALFCRFQFLRRITARERYGEKAEARALGHIHGHQNAQALRSAAGSCDRQGLAIDTGRGHLLHLERGGNEL